MFKNIIFRIEKRFFSQNRKTDIEYLKSKFSALNEPEYYENVLSKIDQFQGLKRASVLIPISFKQDENSNDRRSYFTLSKRNENLRSFSGHVCFMGGRRDKSDLNDVHTAYREAKEEANINSKFLEFICQLRPVLTFNHILVTPVIVYFDQTNYTPILNLNEVDFVFDMPTDRFLRKDGHNMKIFENNNSKYYIHYFQDLIKNRQITTWGFTAFLSIAISSVLHSKQPDFDFISIDSLDSQNLNEFLFDFSLNILKVFSK